jgi:hypothetical protein
MNAGFARRAAAGALLALVASVVQAQTLPRKQFELRVEEVGAKVTGTAGRSDGLPLNRRYAELDADEKARVRANYEGLPPGDEPPYPAEGLLPLFMTLQTGAGKQPPLGSMTLVADVDSTGKVRHVDSFGKFDAEFARFASQVLAATPFKPGQCAGSPCNMQYVLRMQIAPL